MVMMAKTKSEKDVKDVLIEELLVELKNRQNKYSDIKEEKFPDSSIEYVDQKKKSGWMANTWQRIMLRFKRQKAILITMQLKTGDIRHFIAYYDDLEWHWKGKTYLVDDSLKYYDIDSQMFCLDYHEDLAIPIKRSIDPLQIRKSVMIPGVTDVDMAINPSTLKYYVESQFIQKIQRGADLDKVFDFMKRMLILIAIFTGVSLILIIKASGIMNNVHIPGFR